MTDSHESVVDRVRDIGYYVGAPIFGLSLLADRFLGMGYGAELDYVIAAAMALFWLALLADGVEIYQRRVASAQ